MDQQHFPILFHVRQQSLPVDALVLAQNQVGDVGSVIAVAILQQGLGPDHLGRWRQLYGHAIDLRGMALLQPMVGDRDDRGWRTEDYVEKAAVALDLGE